MSILKHVAASLLLLTVGGCTKDLGGVATGAMAPGAGDNVPPPTEVLQEDEDEADDSAGAPTQVAPQTAQCCACSCPAGQAAGVSATAGDAGTEGEDDAAPPAAVVSARAPVPAPTTAPTGTIVGKVTAPSKLARLVALYVEGAATNPKRGMKVSVNQSKMQFIPHFSALSVGGKAVFYNADPFPHNVFSPDHGGFNLGTWGKGGARVYRFKKPGIYTILCFMHPGMLAFVAAVPSSYFDTTNRKGEFKIKAVPNGSYQLVAVGQKLKKVSKPIRVNGDVVTIDFNMEKE